MNPPLTYSNYKLLRECGQRFKLRVIDGVPEPISVNLEYGSAIHAGLNTMLESHDKELAQEVFKSYWDNVRDKITDYGRHGPDELEGMGYKFLANFEKRYGHAMQLVVGERRMKVSPVCYGPPIHDSRGIDAEGTPDALVKWGDKNVLLDFKTSAYNYTDLQTDTSLQLHFYAWLLEQNGYTVDELCYIVMNKATGGIQTPYRIAYDPKKAIDFINPMVDYWVRNIGKYEKNAAACSNYKTGCPFVERCFGVKKESAE